MAAHWFMGVESEFGPVRSPAEPLWLRVHGAAAMGVLVLLGYVVAKHVGPAWRSGRNRFSGGVMVLIHLLLIATGYLLYYAGAESWREWSSAVHIALGTALPLVLLGHIWGGRRTRRQ